MFEIVNVPVLYSSGLSVPFLALSTSPCSETKRGYEQTDILREVEYRVNREGKGGKERKGGAVVLAKIQNAALVRVLQHGRDQTAVDGYRHGDVDVLVEERPSFRYELFTTRGRRRKP
jgi:hypothetical protein